MVFLVKTDVICFKICCVFLLLGFVELPGLTGDDHVTLTIIEHYLDFKVCGGTFLQLEFHYGFSEHVN